MKSILAMTAIAVSAASVANDFDYSSVNDAYAQEPQKSVNLTLNPITPLVGIVDADLGVKVSDQLTIGPRGSFGGFTVNDASLSTFSIGAIAHFNFNKSLKSGPYVRARADYVNVSLTANETTYNFDYYTGGSYETVECSLSASVPEVAGTLGYEWHARSGFNLVTGIGYGMMIGQLDAELECSDGSTKESISASDNVFAGGLALDLRVGFAF